MTDPMVMAKRLVTDLQTQLNLLAETVEVLGLDHLTQLPGRGAFDRELARAVARWARSGPGGSLVLIDLDHFKRINDELGHPTGDLVLKQFAKALSNRIRAGDFAARVGGEEFAVILNGADYRGAGHWIGNFRRQLPVTEPPVTFSAGVVTYGSAVTGGLPVNPEVVYALADSALYRAKTAGRNRTEA